MHIHRNDSSENRIWYPGESRIVVGAYTNNPHVLIRYDIKDNRDRYLSLVLSQYEKHNDVGFTLSCFGTGDFNLRTPIKLPPNKIEVNKAWKTENSGGPPHFKSFGLNPMWSLNIPSPEGAFVNLRCSAVKNLAINIILVKTQARNLTLATLKDSTTLDTGDYRRGFVATDVQWIPSGHYILVASCFHQGAVGAFFV